MSTTRSQTRALPPKRKKPTRAMLSNARQASTQPPKQRKKKEKLETAAQLESTAKANSDTDLFKLVTSGPAKGVYMRLHDKWIRLCPPLKPLGHVVDVDGSRPAMRVKIETRLGNNPIIEISSDHFKSPKELLRTLIEHGLAVEHELVDTRATAISAYLRATVPKRTRLRVKQDGWLRLPDGTYGYVLGEKLFSSSNQYQISVPRTLFTGMHQKGSHEAWLQLSSQIGDDPVAVLVMCAGFASVLLQPMERESTCVIITADSGKGKSTVLKTASALFGPPSAMATWEATENGLEAIAKKQQHKPLVIDEVGQGSGMLFAKAAYRLTNLSGKLRASSTGELLQSSRNFSVMVSAGEQSPIAMMNAAGIAIKEGQRARLLCIPVAEKHGVWSTIRDFASGADKSKKIAAMLNECHGVAGAAFCAHVAANVDNLVPRYEKAASRWRTKVANELKLPPNDGVVDRVLENFALFTYAGMLAVEANAVQWTKSQILRAVRYGFAAWYAEHQRSVPMTDAAIMQQVRLFFQSKRGTKFKPFSQFHDSHTGSLAGYEHRLSRNGEALFLVYPAYFEKEVCKGMDKDRVLKLLQHHRLLIAGARDVPTKQFHVPKSENLNVSFYAVRQSILLE